MTDITPAVKINVREASEALYRAKMYMRAGTKAHTATVNAMGQGQALAAGAEPTLNRVLGFRQAIIAIMLDTSSDTVSNRVAMDYLIRAAVAAGTLVDYTFAKEA